MEMRRNWNCPRVSTNFVDDLPRGMERLRLQALIKAVSISKNINEITLGPNSKQNTISDSEYGRTTKADDVQNELRAGVKKSTRPLNSQSDIPPFNGVDDITRCILKQRAEMDQQRQFEVREKVKCYMRKFEEETKRQREALKFQSDLIQRQCKEKIWQERQEILRQIQEHELRTSQRQLQLAQKHKQHAQRMNARNQIIKEAEKRRKELEEEEKKKTEEKEAEKRRKEFEEEEMKKMNEKRELIEKMIQYQKQFKNTYEEMTSAMRKCKNEEQLQSKVSSEIYKLKKFYEIVEHLVNQCKVGDTNNVDLQEAAKIVQQTKAIKEFVCAEIANINGENEKATEKSSGKSQKEPVKESAAAPMAVAPTAVAPFASSHSEDFSGYADEHAYKVYTALQEYLKNVESSCEVLDKDERLKNFRFSCQKAVNIPVNAIAPTSAAHMQDKYIKLSKLISSQTVNIGHTSFSAGSHPHGLVYCKNLLAKKFVYQGEMTVSSKPEAAFAIAAVIVALWTDFPDFGKLLLAHFHKECPYLVPIFMPQVEGQSNSDYYRTLGYHFSQNGEVETHDKFLKRMSGIMRLYAAILVAHPRRQQSQPNPHGLAQAWRWISCLLNLEPMPDICATLLYDLLDVTGSAMQKCYGLQFQKLLHLIAKEYFPKLNMKATASSGPLVRLEVFLQKILIHQGHFPPPKGILPPNFW